MGEIGIISLHLFPAITYKINRFFSLGYACKYLFIINSTNQTDEKFV